MKHKIYYDPQIQHPELFQIGDTMLEVSSGKTWKTSKPEKKWIYAEIEADNPTQAIHILIEKLEGTHY